MGRRRKLDEQQDKASNGASPGTEKLHFHGDYSNVKNQVWNDVKHEKHKTRQSVVVRRSNRIKSLASPSDSPPGVELEPVVVVEPEPEPEVRANGRRSLEEKVDYLVTTADHFKSKIFKRQDEVPDLPSSEINYKSLYIDSQKKIEALMEEHYNLVRKLEFARGKIAAYEVMKSGMGGPKEVIVVSPNKKKQPRR